MADWLSWLLETSPFKVPTACGGWTDLLASATVASNISIFAVYTAIPILLLAMSRRRSDLAFVIRRRLLFLFAAFIFCCGVTHALRAGSFFWPAYRLQVAVNVLTAVISWVTAAVMVPVIWRQFENPELKGIPLLLEELERWRQFAAETKAEVEEEPNGG